VHGYQKYRQLLATADVQLDPLPFGGGNTSYDGLTLGIPIVTLPSQFLRGRITYALYKQMEMLDCVTASREEYVQMAVRLGCDRDFRQAMRDKILSQNGVLFENRAGVRDLEQFFRGAIQAAAEGQLLT
jgi:predicted O-linked N-acetylglucosamine transferase (SPINDLY family)